MSEQEQISQLSALFDGELPAQQAQMVIRRALKDPAMRASWERYALIGACLRGEPIADAGNVAGRVQARLAAERDLNVVVLPARGSLARDTGATRFSMFGRGALGGAIAAGVAVVSIFVVRAVAPTPDDAGVLLAQGATSAAAGQLTDVARTQISQGVSSAPGSYTTPGENAPASRRLIDASLGSYLVAHSEEAAWALRFSYDAVPQGVELTEDQISALR